MIAYSINGVMHQFHKLKRKHFMYQFQNHKRIRNLLERLFKFYLLIGNAKAFWKSLNFKNLLKPCLIIKTAINLE